MYKEILEYKSGSIIAKLENSEKELVDDVQFALSAGQTLALIGETGSGKTMIALSIMRLLPSNVAMRGGHIFFLGEQITSYKSARRLLGVDIVYIPQNGLEFLNPSKKVRYQLYDSLKKLNIKTSEMESVAMDKLRMVGFDTPEEVIDKYPFQLSGGMAQRVTIAISACSKARLVIADEPTNGLDQEAKAMFMQMLETIFPDAAKLIITHDIAIAALCDRTLVLCGGKMMETGPSDVLLANPNHPYTKALMGALVANGMREVPALRAAEGCCPFYRRCGYISEECLQTRAHHKNEAVEWWCNGQR